MTVTIASGKGGTGKTTLAVNLSRALHTTGRKVHLLDCDVENPNAHLFIQPESYREFPVEVMKPSWDETKCSGCGECRDACQYNAVAVVRAHVLIFDELCHACGVCTMRCPQEAFTEKNTKIGSVQTGMISESFHITHGNLDVGESLTLHIIQTVKKFSDADGITVIDAAPGLGCPVMETLNGSDVAILVTEPTPFGLHDLSLAVQTVLNLDIPAGIVVNKSDGHDHLIAEYANMTGIPVLGRIPFKREYAEVYSRGGLLVDAYPELQDTLLSIYQNALQLQDTPLPDIPRHTQTTLTYKPIIPPILQNDKPVKEIAVISGKGGTGKTTLTGSLALLSKQSVMADNDVEAADLQFLFSPEIYERHDFAGNKKAEIDPELCTGCRVCVEQCHFNAIHQDSSGTCAVDQLFCEGCGMCEFLCPENAVSLQQQINGEWYVSNTDYGSMVFARLSPGGGNSGRMVTQIRSRARELAHNSGINRILGDGPAGIGCPVIAAVTHADRILAVTEPTISGVHDLERALALANHFQVPAYVIINKSDLNLDQTDRIHEIAEKANAPVIAEIPFDRNVHDALMNGKTIVEWGKGPACKAVKHIWNTLRHHAL